MGAPKKNKNAKGNKGGGRKSAMKKEFIKIAYSMALLGATDMDLADVFEVSEQTINNWKKESVEFSLALKRGKEQADANVADRLYQRAMGFEHDSEEIKSVTLPDGGGSEIQRVKVRKIYPPDTTAAIFWLKNRRPKQWRDKQEMDVTTAGKEIKGIPIEFVNKPTK